METVSRSYLYEIHQQQMLRKENNHHNALKIINALGGIDNLLDRLLIEKSIDMTQGELDCIYKIIVNQPQSKPELQQSVESMKIKAHLDRYNQNENTHKSVLILNKDNNYLVLLFGQIIANKILNVIHHNITRLLFVILLIVWGVWNFGTTNRNTWWCIYVMLFAMYLIVYGSFYALSMNKKAFGKIVKTMDFWIQCYYVNILMVNLVWYELDKYVTTEAKKIYIAAEILFMLAALIVVVVVISFDGYPGIRKYKIFWSGFCGFSFIFASISYQFTSYANGDDSIIYIYKDIGFSRLSQMANGSQIIGLFMLKQCIFTYFFKNQAAVMVTRPLLIWEEEKSNVAKLNKNKTNRIIEMTTKNEKDNMSPTEIEQNTIVSMPHRMRKGSSISSEKNIDDSDDTQKQNDDNNDDKSLENEQVDNFIDILDDIEQSND